MFFRHTRKINVGSYLEQIQRYLTDFAVMKPEFSSTDM